MSSTSAVTTCSARCNRPLLDPASEVDEVDGSQQHDGCVGDDVDLHEQGFAKPSKRRGRGGGTTAPRVRGGAAWVEVEEAAALRGEGWRQVGLGFRWVAARATWGGSLRCATPLPPPP